MTAFDNRVRDSLLAEIRWAYEESDLSFTEFMVVLFEVLAYFAEYYVDHE